MSIHAPTLKSILHRLADGQVGAYDLHEVIDHVDEEPAAAAEPEVEIPEGFEQVPGQPPGVFRRASAQ